MLKIIAILFSASVLMSPILRAEDKLSPYCSLKHPIQLKGGKIITRAIVKGPTSKLVESDFLVDTAFDDVALTEELAQILGLKIIEEKSFYKLLTGGEVRFGSHIINQKYFYTQNLPLIDVGGVIGTGVLFSEQLFLNLKDNYICFLKKEFSVDKVADDLKLTRLKAHWQRAGMSIDAEFNGSVIHNVKIDTGSERSSLLPQNIKKLKLSLLGSEQREGTSGKYTSNLYGKDIKIKLQNIQLTIPEIAEAPTKELQKIGMDVLKNSIIGLDYGNKFIFLGF